MLNESLIGDIGKILVALTLILSIYLLSVKHPRKVPHYLFAAFLLLTAVDLTGYFLPTPTLPVIAAFKLSTVLLQMPLFFLYVNAACYFNFTLQFKHLLHGFPFLVFLVLFLTMGVNDQTFLAFNGVSTVQYYAYIVGTLYTLFAFKQIYQAHYSSNHGLTFKWLLRTTILFLIGNSLVILRNLLDSNQMTLQYMTVATSCFALGVVCWFVLSGLHHPNLFSGVDQALQSDSEHAPTPEHQETLQSLQQFMEQERPYLDDGLTLQTLASKINLPEKELSSLINQQLGKHFFDFINSYRIETAKGLLEDQPALTVLEILYKVGFNSKSSFYTAFKKATGTTPTNYRKSKRSERPT
ncbi:MAG: AraC family transcriptional regulator [Bacteroidota bacterium]